MTDLAGDYPSRRDVRRFAVKGGGHVFVSVEAILDPFGDRWLLEVKRRPVNVHRWQWVHRAYIDGRPSDADMADLFSEWCHVLEPRRPSPW